eukprot:TRINITY_DN81168_c0_g1_i1.p1 TRINITY_DN81168_c0_g1~~TRINITY_DN81168_c0_g1_i1.p1  ORF type:complete len:437 (+),score=79.69 TRINITY_DN81168_c0_g1_i1:95-1405(+)
MSSFGSLLPPVEDEERDYVPVRPFSDEFNNEFNRRQPAQPKATSSAASSSFAPRVFRPTMPSAQRDVQQASMASTPAPTAQDLLRSAWRQDAEDGAARHQGRRQGPAMYTTGVSLNQFGITQFNQNANMPSWTPADAVDMLAAPARKAQKKGGAQSLLDLAFSNKSQVGPHGELKKSYTPISLPYFDFTEEEEGDDGSPDQSSHRPKMLLVDEANANAAKQIFLSQAGGLQEEQMLLMQLPAILPELADPQEEVQRDKEDAATAGAGAAITRFPDGKIGKLRVYKSGKVRMEIGGMEFCVDQGCDTFFQQELACVCPLANELVSLGPIRKRVVLTPDFESMLAALPEKPCSSSKPPDTDVAMEDGGAGEGAATAAMGQAALGQAAAAAATGMPFQGASLGGGLQDGYPQGGTSAQRAASGSGRRSSRGSHKPGVQR